MDKDITIEISNIENYTIELNEQGPQGLMGPQGPQGIQGPVGPRGPMGAQQIEMSDTEPIDASILVWIDTSSLEPTTDGRFITSDNNTLITSNGETFLVRIPGRLLTYDGENLITSDNKNFMVI